MAKKKKNNEPKVYESKQVDVNEFSIDDTDAWTSNDAIESLRDALKSLEGSADAISGWSSFIGDDKDTRKKKKKD